MNTTTLEATGIDLTHVYTPDDIVADQPEGNYTDHYQPEYENTSALKEAIHELQHTESVTTPERIRGFRQALGEAAMHGFIVLDASCAEPVKADMPIDTLVEEVDNSDDAVRTSRLGRAIGSLLLRIKRNRGQGTKPRSSEYEVVTSETAYGDITAGDTVVSYMGDGVNGERVDQRTPDPSRMVAMAVQARDLEARLTESHGEHVPAAHEALLLPYEKAFLVEGRNRKRYLLSADLPWVGARTNNPEGAHVELLSGIENAVGVKISAASDAMHIKALAEKLNPDNETDKLVFMLRLGLDKEEELASVLDGIRAHAPNAIIMYDIHGVTKSINGQKIRAIPDIINEIKQLTAACNKRGLRLSGVHLETMGDDSENECVDELGELPTRPGYVDPRLNPRQLQRILDAIADTVLQQMLDIS